MKRKLYSIFICMQIILTAFISVHAINNESIITNVDQRKTELVKTFIILYKMNGYEYIPIQIQKEKLDLIKENPNQHSIYDVIPSEDAFYIQKILEQEYKNLEGLNIDNIIKKSKMLCNIIENNLDINTSIPLKDLSIDSFIQKRNADSNITIKINLMCTLKGQGFGFAFPFMIPFFFLGICPILINIFTDTTETSGLLGDWNTFYDEGMSVYAVPFIGMALGVPIGFPWILIVYEGKAGICYSSNWLWYTLE